MSYITATSPASGSKVNGSNPAIGVTFFNTQAGVDYNILVWVGPNPDPKVSPSWSNDEFFFYSTTGSKTESITSSPAANLSPGTYYATIELYNDTDTFLEDSITISFTLLGTATAGQVWPESGQWLSSTNSNSYSVPFEWVLNKANPADSVRAVQIVVTRQSDGAAVADTGQLTYFSSGSGTTPVDISNTYKNVNLLWKVRLWNAANLPTAYSATRTFQVATAPTVTITSPTTNQVLTTGVASVQMTLDTSSGRTVSQVITSLYTGTTKLWEVVTNGNYADNATLTVNKSNFFYTPGVPYYYSIYAVDNFDLVSAVANRNFSASFASPANPGAVTLSTANYDTSGYIAVSFPDTGRDADFLCWEVEREDALIDPNTQVVYATNAWKSVGRIYTPAGSYEFRDYYAPSNYQVRYRVKQVALKFNAEVNSSGYSTTGYIYPVTQCYWLLSGTNGFTAQMITHRLSGVVSDDFSDETEEAEFVILGRGRYVEKGTYLGIKGQLTAQLRDSAEGTARLKKQALQLFKSSLPDATLRNPFGDEYDVALGNMTVGRIAGTGSSEHCNVTIPYTETVA